MKIPNQTRSTKIGFCPACSGDVYANVDLELEVALPVVVKAGDSFVEGSVSGVARGVSVHHRCGTKPDFLPEADNEALR